MAMPDTLQAGSIPSGAIACLVMAAVVALIAAVPRWRKSWRWGRTGGGAPITLLGYCGIVTAFLTMAAGVCARPLGLVGDPFFGTMIALGGFAIFIASAVVDSVRQKKK